jgi:LacI family transcriptional regulator
VIEMESKTAVRVTQRDIAKAVGVSHVTVSNVLHSAHGARISPEIKREILQMAQLMGYEPRAATTHTIAIAVHPESLVTDILTNTLAVADKLLRGHGYRLTISTLGADSTGSLSQLFNQKTVDGVIFTEWFGAESECLHALRVPWVLLADTADPGERVDQIAPDTVRTSRRLTEHLLAHGHRRICVVTGRAGVGFHDRQVQGVREALRDANLPESCATVIYSHADSDIESELLREVRGENPATAVMVSSPGGAMVVLNRLQRRGVQVPEEVSVVSLTDNDRLLALRPRITATTVAGNDAVKMAIERLIERIARPELEPQRVAVPGILIERESVAQPGGPLPDEAFALRHLRELDSSQEPAAAGLGRTHVSAN